MRAFTFALSAMLVSCSQWEGNRRIRTDDGRTRSYRIHFPPQYDGETPLPLVFVIHGGGGNGKGAQESYGMDVLADEQGFITVYPDGVGPKKLGKLYGTWNGGFCCGDAAEEGVDDVAFFDQLLDRLEDRHAVDTNRIYATGISNGGIMSAGLACALPERFAAVAPVGSPGMPDWCEPSQPVPVLLLHGTEDGCALYAGGEDCGGCYAQVLEAAFGVEIDGDPTFPCHSAAEQWAYWAEVNACEDASETWKTTPDTTCLARRGCSDDKPAVLCTVEGGGHTWPGTEAPCDSQRDWCQTYTDIVGPTSTDTDANALIRSFFEQHSL